MLHVDSTAKQIRKISLDSFFTAKYCVSPYSGCVHNCSYCDGRSEKYYFEGDFNHDLYIKINTPNQIAEQLKKAYEKGPLLVGSGYTDAYQPIEKKFKLTRKILINAQPYMLKHPIVLLTKSDLILRDLDLLKIYAQKKRILVMFSLISNDDNLLKWLEPKATIASMRLKTIETLANQGISVGIAAMPMIPYLTDRNQPLVNFLNSAKSAGAQFVIPGALTLRSGENKNHFTKALLANVPQSRDRILDLYSTNKASGQPKSEYLKEFYTHIYSALDHVGLPARIPMALTQNWLQLYDAIYVFLEHLEVLYSANKAQYYRLNQFKKHFLGWLKTEKQNLKGKSAYYQLLEQATEQLLLNPFAIKDGFNEGIRIFLTSLLNGKTFNYRTKKWD